MRLPLACAATALLSLGLPIGAGAVTLDQACQKLASKMKAAQAAGDTQKAQQIYQVGSQRIAAGFNGASCTNVKPPTP